MRASGGVLDHVRIVGKGSVAGGTASAGLLLTTAALEKAIIDWSNATVEVELDLIGGISYAGLGPRVHKNTAAGVVEALAYVTSRSQHNRAIRGARFIELPRSATTALNESVISWKSSRLLKAPRYRMSSTKKHPITAKTDRWATFRFGDRAISPPFTRVLMSPVI